MPATLDLSSSTRAASISAQRAAALTHHLLAFARRQSLDIRPNNYQAPDQQHGGSVLHRTLGERIELACSLSAELWIALTDVASLTREAPFQFLQSLRPEDTPP
jgi:hypothetical protein